MVQDLRDPHHVHRRVAHGQLVEAPVQHLHVADARARHLRARLCAHPLVRLNARDLAHDFRERVGVVARAAPSVEAREVARGGEAAARGHGREHGLEVGQADGGAHVVVGRGGLIVVLVTRLMVWETVWPRRLSPQSLRRRKAARGSRTAEKATHVHCLDIKCLSNFVNCELDTWPIQKKRFS